MTDVTVDAVDPVYRSWQSLEAADLEFELTFGEERGWLHDLIAGREDLDMRAWLAESDLQRTWWRRAIAAGAWIWAGVVVAVTELVEACD
jgi:hypothetical protein